MLINYLYPHWLKFPSDNAFNNSNTKNKTKVICTRLVPVAQRLKSLRVPNILKFETK